MPANNFSNGGYEKVSLLDEYDENENFFKNSPVAEIKADVNNKHTFEFSVSVPLLTFRYLKSKFKVPVSQQILEYVKMGTFQMQRFNCMPTRFTTMMIRNFQKKSAKRYSRFLQWYSVSL